MYARFFCDKITLVDLGQEKKLQMIIFDSVLHECGYVGSLRLILHIVNKIRSVERRRFVSLYIRKQVLILRLVCRGISPPATFTALAALGRPA